MLTPWCQQESGPCAVPRTSCSAFIAPLRVILTAVLAISRILLAPVFATRATLPRRVPLYVNKLPLSCSHLIGPKLVHDYSTKKASVWSEYEFSLLPVESYKHTDLQEDILTSQTK
ncbi:unnamed protein product [Mesocestoides corti]|uniref:Secreted protein n=1 Tax=Mesocestoides corti TaxID=53468 RepID=A0A0R3U7B0_MESCO|nr:unnamed protein product [Mesocestoides corti]